MSYRFVQENFDTISDRWTGLQAKSTTSHIFSSLSWSKVWWRHFGAGSRLSLASVLKDDTAIGIVPLRIDGDTAQFIGSADVCDYLDFIVDPGEEDNFFATLIENLAGLDAKRLTLFPVRQDSTVVTGLMKTAERLKLETSLDKEDVSVDLTLPSTWEDYLKLLEGKQRHELKRKLRRLSEMGDINFGTITEANSPEIDTFIKFFRESREDKSAFLTPEMESFFRELSGVMAQDKLLRLNFLELNAVPIAATICFDYKDIVYLYNSGYNPEYNWLSAGLLSKALTIQDSISKNKKKFDFLKGNEDYKYHLGGQTLPLFRCSVRLAR